MAAIRVFLEVTLCLSPSLTIRSLFHPQFEYRWKVSETGYHHTKLGSSSQDLAGLYCDNKTWLNEGNEQQQQWRQANPYLKMKLMWGWENQFGHLFFFSCVRFSSWLFYFITFGKTGVQYPQIGVLYTQLTPLWSKSHDFGSFFLSHISTPMQKYNLQKIL
jgi:hypothetical protein